MTRIFVFACAFAMGCGAKTGLQAPDRKTDDGGAEGSDGDSAEDVIPNIPEPMFVESEPIGVCIDREVRESGPVVVSLDTTTRLERSDIVLLIDTSASMQDEIRRIQNRLRDVVVPAIQANIPDPRVGIATFSDFPVEPFGVESDRPFELLLPVTEDFAQVQAAVNSIDSLKNGLDDPESQVEALYQLVTGEGFSNIVPPSFGCADGGRGYACFAGDALPVVLLFTDQVFHNGPDGQFPYSGIFPFPHGYVEAVTELNRIGARVIGFDSGAGVGAADLETVARDTMAVDLQGAPIVFDIGTRGQRLNTSVVDAFTVFSENIVFDVIATARDVVADDGVNAVDFIEGLVPIGASPSTGIETIDFENDVFRGVVAGTTLSFELRLRPDAVLAGPEARLFAVEIVFLGDGVTPVGRRTIEILVPGRDQPNCRE